MLLEKVTLILPEDNIDIYDAIIFYPYDEKKDSYESFSQTKEINLTVLYDILKKGSMQKTVKLMGKKKKICNKNSFIKVTNAVGRAYDIKEYAIILFFNQQPNSVETLQLYCSIDECNYKEVLKTLELVKKSLKHQLLN